MKDQGKIFYEALFLKHPTVTLGIGIMPILLFSTSAWNALFCGVATLVVLLLTAVFVSLLRSVLSRSAETVLYVVISAGLSYLLATGLVSFLPAFRHFFWWFLPFLAVNTLYVWGAENVYSHNKVLPSAIHALGTGGGFLGITLLLGIVRELCAQGTVFGHVVLSKAPTVPFFVLPMGGLLLFGLLTGLLSYLRSKAGEGDTTV